MHTIKYGIYAGILMSLIMSIMSITGDYSIGFVKYIKYIGLLIVLWIAANKLQDILNDKKFFGRASIAGLKISATAGVIVALTCCILFAINPTFAPIKFNLSPDTWGQVSTIGIMFLIETIVIGGILNLIILQGLKSGAETINQ